MGSNTTYYAGTGSFTDGIRDNNVIWYCLLEAAIRSLATLSLTAQSASFIVKSTSKVEYMLTRTKQSVVYSLTTKEEKTDRCEEVVGGPQIPLFYALFILRSFGFLPGGIDASSPSPQYSPKKASHPLTPSQAHSASAHGKYSSFIPARMLFGLVFTNEREPRQHIEGLVIDDEHPAPLSTRYGGVQPVKYVLRCMIGRRLLTHCIVALTSKLCERLGVKQRKAWASYSDMSEPFEASSPSVALHYLVILNWSVYPPTTVTLPLGFQHLQTSCNGVRDTASLRIDLSFALKKIISPLSIYHVDKEAASILNIYHCGNPQRVAQSQDDGFGVQRTHFANRQCKKVGVGHSHGDVCNQPPCVERYFKTWPRSVIQEGSESLEVGSQAVPVLIVLDPYNPTCRVKIWETIFSILEGLQCAMRKHQPKCDKLKNGWNTENDIRMTLTHHDHCAGFGGHRRLGEPVTRGEGYRSKTNFVVKRPLLEKEEVICQRHISLWLYYSYSGDGSRRLFSFSLLIELRICRNFSNSQGLGDKGLLLKILWFVSALTVSRVTPAAGHITLGFHKLICLLSFSDGSNIRASRWVRALIEQYRWLLGLVTASTVVVGSVVGRTQERKKKPSKMNCLTPDHPTWNQGPSPKVTIPKTVKAHPTAPEVTVYMASSMVGEKTANSCMIGECGDDKLKKTTPLKLSMLWICVRELAERSWLDWHDGVAWLAMIRASVFLAHTLNHYSMNYWSLEKSMIMGGGHQCFDYLIKLGLARMHDALQVNAIKPGRHSPDEISLNAVTKLQTPPDMKSLGIVFGLHYHHHLNEGRLQSIPDPRRSQKKRSRMMLKTLTYPFDQTGRPQRTSSVDLRGGSAEARICARFRASKEEFSRTCVAHVLGFWFLLERWCWSDLPGEKAGWLLFCEEFERNENLDRLLKKGLSVTRPLSPRVSVWATPRTPMSHLV
ncbi:uncharacterized protein BDR25DRAFT_360400 [Lindgomyces ingoldianus]|uniref:Uncharacterized protein n=1 Tax=Lindgomyces ingoldianus TaxID=673940 RepID=A0ACB6QH63_9PLEO|nr:uncharacterized protein BDR25DRAFT_360400 [Lindgomyces ingoldianus]KAF2465442.1 hypothetical protein BDR25DRAFT_360400 [Lindgomyces ingoldianus]